MLARQLVRGVSSRSLLQTSSRLSPHHITSPPSTSTSTLLIHIQRRNLATPPSQPPPPPPSTQTTRESSSTDPVTSTIIPSASQTSTTPPAATPISPADTTVTPPSASQPAGTAPITGFASTKEAVEKTYEAGGLTGQGNGGGGSGGKKRKGGHFFRNFGRVTLASLLGFSGYIVYRSYLNRHPPDQLDFDPTKKTLVILGNGWGATSLLKALDNEEYNVIVISPRNYFCFTPLLPSVTVGTLDDRSIIEPTRFISRHKKRRVQVFEAEADEIDSEGKTVSFYDNSEVKGDSVRTTIPYDYLVYAVGAENQTFGIPGVKEHTCFLKEIWDAEKIRSRLMDCIEAATFKGQPDSEIERLLHMVVVGGGPTGVEFAGELHDFLIDDLSHWYPEIAGKVKITLIEALPNVLPMFSKTLIEYTNNIFKKNNIELLTRTMVKGVGPKVITAQDQDKNIIEIPYGLLVWATGNTTREITRKLMTRLGPENQGNKRGITVDDYLHVKGADGIWALGDATATSYAPTAQAASQQGKYLARVFGQLGKKEALEGKLEEVRNRLTVRPDDKEAQEQVESLTKQLNRASKVKPFHYSHQGSLAYIGSEQAIADLPLFNGNVATAGLATMLFWRSAYVSNMFSLRNRALVITDWVKVKIFGRDVSRE